MNIEQFHNTYWFGNAFWLDDHMYYHEEKASKPTYWREEKEGVFDPHFSMNNFSKKLGKKFTPQDIEKIYDSIDWGKYAGKKFILGDYTFYGFTSATYRNDFYKQDYIEHAIYLDYHGYRLKALKAQKSIGYDKKKTYNKSFEGLEIMFQLLNDNPGVVLIDYNLEELIGSIGFIKKHTSEFGLTPTCYLQKKHPEYTWEGAGEKIGKIDLDHFIKMDIKEGIYKPTNSIISKLLTYENREILKATITNLKDFGINTIKFSNNSNWDISQFYNLEGIEVKASKSVLSSYPNMRQFSNDEKAKAAIIAEEKLAEDNYKKAVAADTYTLMQNGKIILENVRSADISNYFENKEEKDFELLVIEAGKQCFKIAPELNKIFFGKYGIYSYTEMSGEKFADFEDLEQINSLKNIDLPKRLVKLISGGRIDVPYIDKYDKRLVFEKGATYIGAAKDENGSVVMIEENGDQGI